MIIESDCSLALGMINDCLEGAPSETIVKITKDVSCQFEFVIFQFVKREGNSIADWLAQTCRSIDANLHIIDVPPFHARKLLLEDKISLPYVRIS